MQNLLEKYEDFALENDLITLPNEFRPEYSSLLGNNNIIRAPQNFINRPDYNSDPVLELKKKLKSVL